MSNTLFFDAAIYDLSMVDKAVKDYSHLAEIHQKSVEKGILCVFEKCQYDMIITMREFSNYCLDLTVHRKSYE